MSFESLSLLIMRSYKLFNFDNALKIVRRLICVGTCRGGENALAGPVHVPPHTQVVTGVGER